jgi:hypothetical protein
MNIAHGNMLKILHLPLVEDYIVIVVISEQGRKHHVLSSTYKLLFSLCIALVTVLMLKGGEVPNQASLVF